MDSRTFESAIAFLISRSRPARPKKSVDVGLPKKPLPNSTLFRGRPPLFGMKEWLRQLGHSGTKLDSLNVIHVAGTKGKGSTCAYIESFLRAHGGGISFPRKTGLYTSPHLLQMNERIRINFEPLAEARFAEYVLEVRDKLALQDRERDGPRYLQLLALVAFHAFLQENVEVAIIETHHGGEYDSTNVIDHPVITAITSIGMDHIISLGPTIENIAWHKAGILKAEAAAFCAPQEPGVLTVLRNRAAAAGTTLKSIDSDSELPGDFANEIQRLNCSLARAVCDEFLRRRAPEGQLHHLSRQAIIDGIRQFTWPGRFHIVHDGVRTWFLDGAHNELSIIEAARWFETASKQGSSPSPCRILIFAQNSTARDGEGVVRCLAQSLQLPINHIVFTTYHEAQERCSNDDKALLERYKEIWRDNAASQSQIWTAGSVGEALQIARDQSGDTQDTQILVTGSLYLIAAALSLGLSADGGPRAGI